MVKFRTAKQCFKLGHRLLQWKWMKMTEESYGKRTILPILHNVNASHQVITLHASLDWHKTWDEGVKWMVKCKNKIINLL